MKYYENILELVGNTPLVRLNRVAKGIKATVLAKIEYFNPGQSVKDRIALEMVKAAEREGVLKPGGTIVEATSGNTGTGLAMAAAVKGYKAVFAIPDKMSREKIDLLRAFGAEVVVTPTAVAPDDPASYWSVAKRIARERKGFFAGQHFNLNNTLAHYKTTGPEIWRDTQGSVDWFVAMAATGGTITGAGRFLKEKKPSVRVVCVDPVGSGFYDYFHNGRMIEENFAPYKVEGVGEDIMPDTIDFKVIDDVIQVTDKECFLMARRLAREEGIFAGGSAGGAVHAALKLARTLDADQTMVVMIPDTGRAYLSKMYDNNWMRHFGFLDYSKSKTKTARMLAAKQKLRRIISIPPYAKVSQAIELMAKHGISQLPVEDEQKFIGSLGEDQLLGLVFNDSRVLKKKVSNIMQKPFPTLPIDSPVESIYYAFAVGNQAVIIVEGEKTVGILTKTDFLQYYSQKE